MPSGSTNQRRPAIRQMAVDPVFGVLRLTRVAAIATLLVGCGGMVAEESDSGLPGSAADSAVVDIGDADGCPARPPPAFTSCSRYYQRCEYSCDTGTSILLCEYSPDGSTLMWRDYGC